MFKHTHRRERIGTKYDYNAVTFAVAAYKVAGIYSYSGTMIFGSLSLNTFAPMYILYTYIMYNVYIYIHIYILSHTVARRDFCFRFSGSAGYMRARTIPAGRWTGCASAMGVVVGMVSAGCRRLRVGDGGGGGQGVVPSSTNPRPTSWVCIYIFIINIYATPHDVWNIIPILGHTRPYKYLQPHRAKPYTHPPPTPTTDYRRSGEG